MHHYRSTIKLYKERQKTNICPFCNPKTLANAVYENDELYIVPNLTQYDLWEMHNVVDHLLIIPKQHVEALAGLSTKERAALVDIMAQYEVLGYSAYARGVGFVGRSVRHQHTHLIKVDNTQPKAALFLQKPYILVKR